jgi:hypothetical protein
MSNKVVIEPDSNDSETTANPAGAPAAWSLLDRDWLRDLACCLLLVLLVLVFFWRILTPDLSDRHSFPPGDFIVTFYATERVKAEMLLQGEPPLWNPYANSGHPLLADPQTALYYPPSLLTVLLSARGGLSVFALQLEAVFHFCLAALFTFAFARRVLGHRGGALMAAIGFTFGGYLTGYPSLQLAILRTVVWLPLILLGLETGALHLVSGNRRAWAAFAGAGLVLGLSVLAGHAQSAMYVLYASLAYLLIRLWRGRSWGQILAAAGLFVVVGVGISAAQWLPSLEYMRLSTRSGMSYAHASSGFKLVDALQLVLPTQSPLYAGVLTLLLALSALVLVRARMVRFWAGLGLVALLLSFILPSTCWCPGSRSSARRSALSLSWPLRWQCLRDTALHISRKGWHRPGSAGWLPMPPWAAWLWRRLGTSGGWRVAGKVPPPFTGSCSKACT